MNYLLKPFCLIFLCSILTKASSQNHYSGIVRGASSGEILSNASISFFKEQKLFGLITNKEGQFSFTANNIDSIRFSMIGYKSRVFYPPFPSSLDDVRLEISPTIMGEVVINRLSATEIIQRAITKISAYQPQKEFENKAFYREIIKDKENYFSVSEALFQIQYFPKKRDYKLKLDAGRSKEDVKYTRLFEDYHPGGGPQIMAEQSFLIKIPDCLVAEKMNLFSYARDSIINYDGRNLYVISFDQKKGVKEALEKGQVFIDAEDFSILRYEAGNSPIGETYIKSLQGTDKIMAEILKIDFKVWGWSRRLYFTNVEGKSLLSFAAFDNKIRFKEPKKNIDLDLSIEIELLFTELNNPIVQKITSDDEWKTKNLVINLPVAFDSSFWGGNTVITPTEKINNIVTAIAKNNGEQTITTSTLPEWNFFNRNVFVGYKQSDTIIIIPVMKSSWNDESSGGLLYQEIEGDFVAECTIALSKNSIKDEMPDNGFQQTGIMVRNNSAKDEEYILASIGTGGNATPKIFFKKTNGNRSKTVLDKINSLQANIKLEKKGNIITSFAQINNKKEWIRLGEGKIDTTGNKLQLGLACFAQFAGDGPKMRPDMKASISNWRITKM